MVHKTQTLYVKKSILFNIVEFLDLEYITQRERVRESESDLVIKKLFYAAGINGAEMLNFEENLYDYVNSPQNLKYSLREKRQKLLAMDILIHKAKDTFSKEPNWSNIPYELHFDFFYEAYCLIFHPLVYLYFMDFLCNKHLNEMKNAFDAIRELEYIVSSVCKYDDRPMAHLILGIVYQEVKRFDDALYQYETSLSFRDTSNSAFYRRNALEKFIIECKKKMN